MRRCALSLLFALGCTSIPEPFAEELDAAPPPLPDAGGDGGYTGPCVEYGSGAFSGVPVFLEPSGGAAVLAYRFFVTTIPEDDEIRRVELYAAGIPAELRGVVLPFDTGPNANLQTCVHCLLVHRECDPSGTTCAKGPYYPRVGRAVAAQMPEAVGQAFAMELADVELVRVVVDDALQTTPASGDEDCIHIRSLEISGTAVESTTCDLGIQCLLAPTASERHP